MDAPTLYERLEVAPDASSHEIAAAYRAQARRYHPDVNAAPDAEAMMVLVNDAFAVLGDPQRRRDYDSSLRVPEAAAAAAVQTYPDAPPARRPKTSGYLGGDVWGKRSMPDVVRHEAQRQAAVRELRAYWRENYEVTSLGGVASMIGTMLVLPVFVIIVFLLVRAFRLH